MSPEEAPSGVSRRSWWAVLLPLWLASLLYTGLWLNTGWIPCDEGTLAQAAERVALGELPHRDFDEVYTGGLDWLNAAAFRVFGTNLRSMRIPLFLLFALWVPAMYWIATRFTTPLLAAPCVALAVTWSLPTHPAPMPSWYVLFLATFGAAALLEYAGGGRRRWLVAAGACGGLAVLAKVTGLHFVAAALLFLAWKEPGISSAETGGAAPGTRPGRGLYPAALTLGLLALVALLVKQVWPIGMRWCFDGEIEHFVVPEALVAALVARRAWTRSRAPDLARFRTMLGLLLPFALGFVIPVLAFVVPFAAGGAIHDLVFGVLVLPGARLGFTTMSTTAPGLSTLWYAAPLVAIALIPPARGRTGPRVLLVGAGIALAGAVVMAALFDDVFYAVHLALRHLVPIVVALAVWRLWRRDDGSVASDRVLALASVTAFASLVQFPWSVPMYFFYAAPLIMPLSLATLAQAGIPLRERPGIVVLLGFLLALMLVAPMRIGTPWHAGPTERLATPRGGLAMHPHEAAEYARLVSILEVHARGGFVWAGPDAPEVAFLAGLRNPTRTIFDCFDQDFGDPGARSARILQAIDARGVTAVAVHQDPLFSGPPPAALMSGLTARFPRSERVGRYLVAWKE